ncbi:ABC transporter substrate-binding protein [Eoetvoesiella caeni]
MFKHALQYLGVAMALSFSGLTSNATAADLKIGLLLSQTGPLATYGTSMKSAAEYAVKQVNDAGGINGNKVTLALEDDASKPTTFLNGLNRLVGQEKVLALVGPITSGFFLAGVPIVKEHNVLMISPTATAPNLTKGAVEAFRNNPSEDVNIPVLLKYIKSTQPDISSIAIIYDNKESADKIIGGLYESLAPSVGWKQQSVTKFLSGQLNYSDVVSKALRDKPDVVAVASHAEDAANVARELRRQGYSGIILGGTSTVSHDYIKIAGDAANGTYAVVPYYYGAQTPQNTEFLKGYKKFTERTTIDPWEASTYESMKMILHAMKQAQVTGDPAKLKAERASVRENLASTRDFPGLMGDISFNDERVAVKPSVIIKVHDGEWIAN